MHVDVVPGAVESSATKNTQYLHSKSVESCHRDVKGVWFLELLIIRVESILLLSVTKEGMWSF